MWEYRIFGTELYYILQWFFIYSILGWIVESIYMSFCERRLVNRGFIFGPICPIYGVGALSVYFILRPLEGNWIALYFCGAFLATALELLTAVVMKRVFGEVWWDYNQKPCNFHGILCLESTVAWGFYTIFMFGFLHGAVKRIAASYPLREGRILVLVLIAYYLMDFGYHVHKNRRAHA